MKANELMINDWVKFKADTFGEQKQRVDYLESERVQERLKDDEPIATTANGTFFCTSFALQEYQVEPIPISDEILKENGFIQKDIYKDGEFWDYIYSQHDDEHDFYCKARFVDSRGIACCEFSYYTYGILSCNVGSIKLRYVHEFQHAMRLVGLADLADNFKVMEGGDR